MYRHLLVLPDGTQISSGPDAQNAICSVQVTQKVNNGQELTLGSVCAGQMEAELMVTGGLSLSAGDTVTLFREDEEQNRERIGLFWLEKPVCSTPYTMTLTAYDSVSRLDKDLTGWLAALDQWPYSVRELADMVCLACDLTLAEGELPNGDFFIEPFAGEGVTGRHLMQWLGQITGRFCRARPDGTLEFAWYAPIDTAITCDGAEGVFYYQGEMTCADYTVHPVEKVQLRESAQDVGTLWPDEPGQKNTYIIENNPMLAAQTAQSLTGVAQTLYENLQGAVYTPCKVTIPATPQITAGSILPVTDPTGRSFSMWVMQKTSDGQRDTLECTGSHRRDSTAAVNALQYRALSGKVLNLRTDVDGLKVENRDKAGKLASVELQLTDIRSRVESQETAVCGVTTNISALTQTAQSLQLELETIREEGSQRVKTAMGYTFDDKGLRICRSDSDVENLLDHTGMYVRRGADVVLQADNQGVEAVDVTVRNYLIVGENTRFEDYTDSRTACFYLG